MRFFKRKGGASTSSQYDETAAYPDGGAAEVLFERNTNSHHHPPIQNNTSMKRGKDCNVLSRDGIPIITAEGADHFSPSAVNGTTAVSGIYSKRDHVGSNRPRVRPSAKSSAFGGAPRYDWMDIETTAAIKVQAVWRRIQTQNRLDRAGLSTPGMRNRRRKRNARYKARMKARAEDVPFPFNMCGVGLLFGDATLEDEAVTDDMERRKLRKEKEEYELAEERKRKYRMRKKASGHVEEGIEVLDD